MKTEWPEANRDETEKERPTTQNETKDVYNDEMARNAVGSLFNDVETANASAKQEKNRYVTGFDKPQPESRPAPPPRVHMEPPLDETGDTSGPPVSRRRPSSREPNPTPRPAVRATQPNPRDRYSKSRPLPQNLEEDTPDEYEGFRKRYKNHEAVPSPRVRVEKERAVEKEKKLSRSSVSEYDDEEVYVPALRWVAIGGIAVVLVIMAALVYHSSSLSKQLKTAMATIEGEGFSDNDIEVMELQLIIEEKDKDIKRLTDELDRLTVSPSITWEATPTPDPDEPDNPNQPGQDEIRPSDTTPAPGNTDEQRYTVKSGDTLSSISTEFYGTSREYQRIKDANGMTGDSLSIGQVLIIPPR